MLGAEIGVAEIKSHRNVRLDVDQLRRRRLYGHRFGRERVGVVGGVQARRHGGRRKTKERRSSGSR